MWSPTYDLEGNAWIGGCGGFEGGTERERCTKGVQKGLHMGCTGNRGRARAYVCVKSKLASMARYRVGFEGLPPSPPRIHSSGYTPPAGRPPGERTVSSEYEAFGEGSPSAAALILLSLGGEGEGEQTHTLEPPVDDTMPAMMPPATKVSLKPIQKNIQNIKTRCY